MKIQKSKKIELKHDKKSQLLVIQEFNANLFFKNNQKMVESL